MKPFSFGKADRIRTQAEYRFLSKNGARFRTPVFILIYRSGAFPHRRLGLTVSKKVGNAVTRNRIKRSVREHFRLNRSALPAGLDINIIARQPAGKIGAAAIRSHLNHCLVAIAQEIGNQKHG